MKTINVWLLGGLAALATAPLLTTNAAQPSPATLDKKMLERAERVSICHCPPGNPRNCHTITVGASALPAHLAHRDTIGACDLGLCGDGITAPTEQCDDANDVAGDGCTPLCIVEEGWTCSGSPSVCTLSPLEVVSLWVPPVTSACDAATQTCTLTVTNASATLRNLGSAGSFDDIVLESVEISYAWDTPALVTPPRSFALSGVVPFGGSSGVSFPPISLGDLLLVHTGHSASLSLVFRGHTLSGGVAQAAAHAVLAVNACSCP